MKLGVSFDVRIYRVNCMISNVNPSRDRFRRPRYSFNGVFFLFREYIITHDTGSNERIHRVMFHTCRILFKFSNVSHSCAPQE